MASRFASFGARWWVQQGPQLSAVGAVAACSIAQSTRWVRSEGIEKKDSGRGPELTQGANVYREGKRPDQDAADLIPYHLTTWNNDPATMGHIVVAGHVPERKVNKYLNPMAVAWPHMNFLNPDELVMGQGHIIINDSKKKSRSPETANGCFRANACKDIYWDPTEVRAAVVTCGGLCPGLNSIIREVTNCLWHQYGCHHVFGIMSGYNGLSNPETHKPVQLTPKTVRDIHMKGGSILQAGRGGFDAKKICDRIEQLGINMIFTVGGDGTQNASNLLYEEAKRRNLKVSIVGVPKSIDNDVLFFDKTFGFDSAVASASEVIRNAYVEANSCNKGVGIVKLMGRDAGFVAMHAALASTIVDLVLIPEVNVSLDDVKAHVDATISRKEHMVIAVAEGAGQEFVSTGKKDATGHTVYGDIGTWLRDEVNAHLKPQGGRSFYIDPSYIIRSVPIRPNDHIYCSRLARDAVHTAMRGYTGVCVGPINNVIVIIPAKLIAAGKRKVNLHSSAWQSCVQSCNMPLNLTGLDHK